MCPNVRLENCIFLYFYHPWYTPVGHHDKKDHGCQGLVLAVEVEGLIELGVAGADLDSSLLLPQHFAIGRVHLEYSDVGT